jgi:hypothetical protein
VATHERAPGLFVERIEPEQLLRMVNRVPECPIVFEEVDQTRQHLPRTLTETFAVGVNPFARALGQQVALIEPCGFLQASAVPCQTAIGGGLERHQVHNRAGPAMPRQSARAGLDEGVQPRPAFP